MMMIVNRAAGIIGTMPLFRIPLSAWVGILGLVVCLDEARVVAVTAPDSSWSQDNCDVLGMKSALFDGSYICCSTDDTDLLVPFTLSSCRQEHTDHEHAALGYAECDPVRRFGSARSEGPHMDGLRGQSIEWSGEDGGWYALIRDTELELQINVRVTAPFPLEFPRRQLVTGVSILFDEHSFVVEANSPYSTATSRCPVGVGPCLASGALEFAVDNERPAALLGFLDGAHFRNGLTLSATNVPVECGQFGGGSIWAATHEEMLKRNRLLTGETFEEWVLKFRDMAAPDWCAKYVSERGLADVQSTHSVLRIETPLAAVRVSVGPTYHGGGDEKDWDGRVLSDLDFWQMDVGLGYASELFCPVSWERPPGRFLTAGVKPSWPVQAYFPARSKSTGCLTPWESNLI